MSAWVGVTCWVSSNIIALTSRSQQKRMKYTIFSAARDTNVIYLWAVKTKEIQND